MKIICVGRNYSLHTSELGNSIPKEPIIFLKPDTAIHNLDLPYYLPDFSNELHYEVELVIKINKQGKYILDKFANRYYQEIGLGIDFTARDLQKNLQLHALPWELSKSFDGSAIVGKFFPKEDFYINNLSFSLLKNKEVVQTGNSTQMIWKIDELIAYVSKFFTLRTGDLLFTGTPSGVGRVVSGDILEGFLEKEKAFTLRIH